jgi:DnaK suppressor protein
VQTPSETRIVEEFLMSNEIEHLDHRFLARQKGRLMDLKKILQGTLDSQDEEQSSVQSQSLGEARETEDDAQKLAALEIEGILASRSAQRLLSVERALRKIEDGTYGFSDASGKSIARDRLEAMPEAMLTLEEEAAADAKGGS